MSYLTQSHIAANGGIFERSAQAAATEGYASPELWARQNNRVLASQPGWDAAWESALVNNPQPGYDPGTDESVITDGMILSAVQLIGEEPAP